MRQSLLLACLVLLFGFFPRQVFAQEKAFDTTFVANYVVDETGVATIEQNISLTNLTSNTFASEYAVEIGSNQLTQISATNSEGEPIPFETVTTNNTTIIKLTFNKQVVGKDKVREFTIAYKNKDAASLKGRVLEVTIPGLADTEDVHRESVNVFVPKQFSSLSQISPEQYSATESGTTKILRFEGLDNDQSITALFGDHQVMSFSLNYHLDNPTVNKAITQIALPPDTHYQQMFYEQIEPLPDKITSDEDGNWLATYVLDPKESFTVVAQGDVKLFLEPTIQVPNNVDKLDEYVKPTEYWPVKDDQIQTLAKELHSAQAIYDYIVENFTYDYSKIDGSGVRLGGKTALNQPEQAICQEFSDAFISLARASGIPAREINGFAYTQNSQLRPLSLIQDVLHSWPEYYDQEKQLWIPIDPTWGNTTGTVDYFSSFDLNHFAFVIHGTDDSLPFPAGYYKQKDTTGKDVTIEFSQEEPIQRVELEVSATPSITALLGLPGKLNLKIDNNGNTALYNIPIELTNSDYSLDTTSIESILPLTEQQVSLKIESNRLLSFKLGELSIQASDQNYDIQLSFASQIPIVILSGLAVGLTGIIGSIFAWSLLVSRRK